MDYTVLQLVDMQCVIRTHPGFWGCRQKYDDIVALCFQCAVREHEVPGNAVLQIVE